MSEIQYQRKIRSYVLRHGRLTKGQQQALDNYWQDYGIDFEENEINPDEIYQRRAPLILDIGIGMGDSCISLARSNPDNNYLGIDVHPPGIGSALRQIHAHKLSNVRLICHDVIDVLEKQLLKESVDSVYIFFPDPWPKKRHHKRRLINKDFLDLLIPKLYRHARIFIATDWEDLAEHVITVCDSHPDLINLAGKGNSAPRPVWRPLTKFEQRGKNLGHGVWDFIYARN